MARAQVIWWIASIIQKFYGKKFIFVGVGKNGYELMFFINVVLICICEGGLVPVGLSSFIFLYLVE